MLLQFWIVLGFGVAGVAYLVGYEQLVMVPALRQHGAEWVYQNHQRWKNQRFLPYTILVSGLQELVFRGLPMLVFRDVGHLAVALVFANVIFVLAHRDRDIISKRGYWLGRFLGGVILSIPALFGSLVGCWALHAAVNVRAWFKSRDEVPDRVLIMFDGGLKPTEILTPGTQPSQNRRNLIHRPRTIQVEGT